jgi:hypothetical protein
VSLFLCKLVFVFTVVCVCIETVCLHLPTYRKTERSPPWWEWDPELIVKVDSLYLVCTHSAQTIKLTQHTTPIAKCRQNITEHCQDTMDTPPKCHQDTNDHRNTIERPPRHQQDRHQKKCCQQTYYVIIMFYHHHHRRNNNNIIITTTSSPQLHHHYVFSFYFSSFSSTMPASS